MNNIIIDNIQMLKSLCKKYKVKDLYAFGSVITDKFSDKSDIDLLVSFEEGIPLLDYADNYFDFKDNLAQLFNREVDLVTKDTLTNPYFINEVEKSKTYIYG